jgi:hypothetical protein
MTLQVACKQLVGLYLSVWARKHVARNMRGIQATSAATGWGGYLGNKGAVAVRLRMYDAPLCVVCSHLPSGDAKGDEQRRNSDVADIMRRCVFENPDTPGGQHGLSRLQAESMSLNHRIAQFMASCNMHLASSVRQTQLHHLQYGWQKSAWVLQVWLHVCCLCRGSIQQAGQQQQQRALGQHVRHPGPPQCGVAR